MRVAIFNVKYSPNLGDGVIAECLEYALRQRAGWTVWSIDLAGREAFAAPNGGRNRAFLLALLHRMPGWLRDATVGPLLEFKIRTRLMKRWRELLKGADAAIFGGGQLIQDTDLNFPIKLTGAAAACQSANVPVAVYAVGATRCRSSVGRRLFRCLFRSDRLVYVAARDEASCAVLNELGSSARSCVDPGLLAAEVWPAPARKERVRRCIGLGITHPAVLAHHGGWSADRSGDAISLYTAMAEYLVAAGFDVVCFTNGAAEDELFLAEMKTGLFEPGRGPGDVRKGSVHVAPRCGTPGELARLIAGFDCVVAHRLHAAILAYAYRVPSVGLRWDDKVARFYQLAGRGDFLMPFDAENAGHILRFVRRSMERPIEPSVHERLLAEAKAGIDCLAAALVAALGPHAGVPTKDRAPVRRFDKKLSADVTKRTLPKDAEGANLADEEAL